MMETVNQIRIIQCHHNYTERLEGDLLNKWKHSKGSHGQIWLSRKGAIDASAGRPGLIPGSMGTASYVVTGLGNPMSLNSSPHGAGRNFSRAVARKSFDRAYLDLAMTGIVWGESDEFLDEAPGAYKDIDIVMNDVRDLVKIEHTLHQILNVKGYGRDSQWQHG
jgi:tRNA-splicing ligase RtcB